MVSRIALSVGVAVLISLSVIAESISFDEGWVRPAWSEDGRNLVIEAMTRSGTGSGTWVITAIARRFDHGVFAWQAHIGPIQNSLVVIPNDFSTARRFSLEQLGIEVEIERDGSRLTLSVPTDGTIPHLIAPDDVLQLHALWLSQHPLVTISIPDRPAMVAGEGAAGMEEPIASPVPDIQEIARGVCVQHLFRLPDDVRRPGAAPIALSYTLLRMDPGNAAEFVRYAQIGYNIDEDVYSYEIDTISLSPGTYRLVIGSSSTDLLSHGLRLSTDFHVVEEL